MLSAGAATTAGAAVSIVHSGDPRARRTAISGVLMPDDRRYRAVAKELLARERPARLSGLTIIGDTGTVRLLPHHPGRPSLLSTHLNPGVLDVLARAAGAATDAPIVVSELRLEVLTRTGRQRWRMRGTQLGRLWRASVNPNGTDLRRIRTGAPAASEPQ